LNKDEFSFDKIDENIVFVDLINRAEIEAIAVTETGRVIVIDIGSGDSIDIGELCFDPSLLRLQSQSFNDYVCVSQIYSTRGTVLDLTDRRFSKRLERGDYCAEVSTFPIAFLASENGTLLIHGTDWNRLDITRLETDELLTDRVVDYDAELNFFDYFHSGLSVSPDSQSFISNGWHWHPYGQITSYTVERFLEEFESSHLDLELTDDLDAGDACFQLGWDRPVCWIGDNTLGIGYSRTEGYFGEKQFPSEILIYDLRANKIVRRVEFDAFPVGSDNEFSGDLHFNADKEQFIGLNKRTGLLIADIDGRIVANDPELRGWKYNAFHKLFYKANENEKRLEIARYTV